MLSWTPIVVVWFLSLFFSVFIVSYFLYREIKSITQRHIQVDVYPGILVWLLLAAFFIALIWFLVERNVEDHEHKLRRKAWVFIGVFLAMFAVCCVLVTVFWSKGEKWTFRIRNHEITAENSLPNENNAQTPSTTHGKAYALPESSLQESFVEDTKIQPVTAISNQAINVEHMDHILCLRNLSNSNEDYLVNLSDSSAPVVRRTSSKQDPQSSNQQFLNYKMAHRKDFKI